MKDLFSDLLAYASALGISFGPPAYAPAPQHQEPPSRPAAVIAKLGDDARRPFSYLEANRSVPGDRAPSLRFPKGFMWGVAVSGTQVEGWDQHSSWAAWERSGRTREPKGIAADSWARYEDDLALAARTGASAFRLSIEWSRVEPREGEFDRAALARYGAVLDAARKLGMEPVVTLYHFAYPQWLEGGWEALGAPVAYARYVETVATALRGKARYWITINEPNLEPGLGYLVGVFPPGRVSPLAFARATENILRAHVAAYDILHRHDPGNLVSTNVFRMVRRQGQQTVTWLPAMEPGESMLDRLAAWADRPGGPPRSTLDYVAFDYYYAFTLPEFFQLADYWRWPVHPPGIYDAARYYFERYRLPVLVAENGMAEHKREPRPDGWTREAFILNHAYELQRAVADGVPVLGYFYWSLMDNYEWGSYTPTFGLYRVDRDDPTLRRKPTPAADVFRRIARDNAIPADLLERYLYRRS